MSSKLNRLISQTSPGSLTTHQWLKENGISYSLARKYSQNNWLQKLGNGVYYRPGRKPDWADAVCGLTEQLHLSVHMAGLTSLNYQGLSHYLQLRNENIWIGVKNRRTLPAWFKTFPDQQWLVVGNHKLSDLSDKDFTMVNVDGRNVKASSLELAAYEVAEAVGTHISFSHAAEVFQSLVNLRPRRVQSILERSSAVRTNRVFLYLSHHFGHQWFKRLDETQIELGTGKRQVVEGGRLDARYQITVPIDYFNMDKTQYE